MNAHQTTVDFKLLTLIRASLATWGVGAMVTAEPNGQCRIKLDDGSVLVVARAPPGIPFRWLLITPAGRERPASSITGLLRVLRSTIDPSWRPGRARVVAVPLV